MNIQLAAKLASAAAMFSMSIHTVNAQNATCNDLSQRIFSAESQVMSAESAVENFDYDSKLRALEDDYNEDHPKCSEPDRTGHPPPEVVASCEDYVQQTFDMGKQSLDWELADLELRLTQARMDLSDLQGRYASNGCIG